MLGFPFISKAVELANDVSYASQPNLDILVLAHVSQDAKC